MLVAWRRRSQRLQKLPTKRAAEGRNFKVGNLMRARIWLGVLIGSTVGGFLPDLWGAGLFSYSSVLLSGIGGFAGLWFGYKMS
jgi:hypothetical protein